MEISKLKTTKLPFLVQGMDNEIYHSLGETFISKTGADIINKAPALYYEQIIKGNKPAPTKALNDGRRYHTYVLEPHKRETEYFPLPADYNPYTVAGKAQKAEIIAAGKIPITQDEHNQALNMAEIVRNNPLVKKLLDGATIEASIFWRDFVTGTLCRCRPDIINTKYKIAADYKSTSDSSYQGFRKSIGAFRYHCQAGHYLAGIKQIYPEIDKFLFIAQEKNPPYLVAIYELDGVSINKGALDISFDYRKFTDCQERNEWPGYGDNIYLIDAPNWA